jgi:hypothetical protein
MNPKTSVSTASKSGVGPSSPQTEEDLDAWIREEKGKQEQKLKENLKNKGLNPYLKLEVGSTTLFIARRIPVSRINSFGKQVRDFTVEKDGEVLTWSVSENGALYRKLLSVLEAGRRDITVVRVGTGKETKYDVI